MSTPRAVVKSADPCWLLYLPPQLNRTIRMSDAAALEPVDDAKVDPMPATARPAALITLALAVGSFGIGTGEFAIMVLLPDIAAGLGVTVPTAGHLISAYALGVVVGAPMIALLAAKVARRTLLLFLMLSFAACNAASALAPGMPSLLAVRFLAGLPHGAYFGVAALVAASAARPSKRVQAVGRVMLGLMVATLIGTPLATSLGQIFGWRFLFMLVAMIAVLTVILLWATLPRDKVQEGAGALHELGALMRGQVWLTFAVAAIGFGGMFAVFSYIAPTATDVAGLPRDFIPVVLAIFGAGMIAGNLIGAWLADRWLMGMLAGTMGFSVAVTMAFAMMADNPVALCTCVFLIGGFSAASGPALQTRLMDVAGDAQVLAAASLHSAYNIANALGAWLGGLAIAASYGYASTGWVGAALALAGLGILALSYAAEQASVRARGKALP